MKLIWLDLETTGLDPQKNKILEVSVSEADFLDPFNVKHIYHANLYFPKDAWPKLDPFILNMHTGNGLLTECVFGTDLSVVECDLLDLIPEAQDKEERPILAGSTISFDHGFIKVHMPKLAARLSHRHYDVSAFKLLCQSLGMEKFKKAEAHRAKADVEESIAHGRACVKWLYSEARRS